MGKILNLGFECSDKLKGYKTFLMLFHWLSLFECSDILKGCKTNSVEKSESVRFECSVKIKGYKYLKEKH